MRCRKYSFRGYANLLEPGAQVLANASNLNGSDQNLHGHRFVDGEMQ
jgi:hypothetical protein